MTTHTPELAHALHVAQALAREWRHGRWGAPQLLAGLLHNDTGLPAWLAARSVDVPFLREWAEMRLERYPKAAKAAEEPLPDETVRPVFEIADMVRLKLGEDGISPFAVLVALCRPGAAFSKDQLKSFPLTEESLLKMYLGDVASERQNIKNQTESDPAKEPAVPAAGGALQKFCTDKTLLAATGKLDPIIGREQELRQLTEVLGRRTKPNVIITGEPGVGKTALVDGFAQDIAAGNVPKHLQQARVFELDTGALAAGASYKGEVEDRLKNILRELASFEKAILFVDEIHALLDPAGGLSGTVNLLKPLLARGELTVIGATTREEYRKFVEREEAFQRRFEVLQVDEPDEATALLMVQHLLSRYEEHHSLTLADDAPAEAVRLARRYLKDRRLPDSALDLIDRTMAAVRLDIEIADDEARQPEANVVGKDALTTTVARKTGIPVGRLQEGEQEKLLQLEAQLRRRVIGQDRALAIVADAIREARSGLTKPGQPVGSFFLLGPTGTGKTELAKSLTESLFGDESALIRFDMSEFMEEHSAALLYGAPPGYVGYEEGGLLVNKIRQQPYAVVLFDEIEKAHPSVFRIFLQILDEGKLHDRLGKEGDFSNAVVLFTSNVGAEWVTEQFGKGVQPDVNQLKTIMGRHFAPEFLGRLTDIVPFAPISDELALGIFDIQLRQLSDVLAAQGIALRISDEAKKAMVGEGFHPQFGARPLRGVIRDRLRRPISKLLIEGALKTGDTVEAAAVAGQINLIVKKSETPAKDALQTVH